MSIFHYFSKDESKRAKFIFNLIAPIYNKADKLLADNYTNSIGILSKEIEITGKKVLDIGTGTGAWAAKFLNFKDTMITGIDFSEKMLNAGKISHPEINFILGDAENLVGIEDNSFDIVTASYVVHGVKEIKRARMISEMKRISREYVIIHDFVGKTPLFIQVLEFLEQSDYKNFKKNFHKELDAYFEKTWKINSDEGSGLYIASH